ncbi:MAG TPA: DUF3488 and transglutaminase-like domain-containing protein, partial [Polyangiaceae bacterium LLY-WYZ-15_(1-7)]|nr:DUF3488 and transglutaminase-like domain-containing protein [Polyangiaceae bacterium LLY-WYZ-15_(1-7)]
MSFGRLHTLVTYLMAGVGLFALSLGGELSPGALALLFLGYALSLPIGPRLWARPAYTSFWNGAVLAVLGLQLVRGFTGAPILPLLLEYAGFLQLAKLFHRRTAKDHQHVQALAFLHLIAATVLTTGMEYALAFLGYVLLTPWMFALTHLRAEIEIQHDHDPEAVARALRSRRLAGWRFLFGTAALALPLFVVTAAFFILFPRVGMGFLSFGAGHGRQVAGFGSNVELGGFGTIRDDPTVVLRVVPDDLGASPPARRAFRLRGTSFDLYRDAAWSRSGSTPRRLRPRFDHHVLVREPRGVGDERTWELILDPLDEPVLFLPEGTIALKIPPKVQRGMDVQRRITIDRGLDVRYGDPNGLAFRYEAILDPGLEGLPAELDEEARDRYLSLPPGQERIAALASRVAGSGDDRARAARLLRWLRDSGEYTYSLEQPDTRGRDPLEVFLFDAKRGHCEYFSTALAVSLRTQGIPARNVTGFVGGVYNPYGRYYAIRQGDAHSWVEAYLDGAWVPLDPTPPSREAAAPASEGFFADVRAFLDAMRTRWSRDVVGYDLRQQVSGLRGFFRWLRSFRSEERRGAERERGEGEERERSEGAALPWKGIVGGVLILFGVGALGRWWWRRRRRKGEGPPPASREASQLYRRLEKALARAGRPRPPAVTPREHARALEDEGFPESEAVQQVTDAYEAARFGGEALDPAQREALKARIREVARVRV